MFFVKNVFLLLGAHELKFGAAFVIAQRVDEQVEIVGLFDLGDEEVDVVDEFFRVDIDDKVDVELVLP